MKGVAGKRARSRKAIAMPSRCRELGAEAADRGLGLARAGASSGLRRSSVITTVSGTTLTLPGWTRMTPELASWPGIAPGQLVGEDVDPRRREPRILAIGHRRRAGMARPALQRQFEPADRLDAGDGAEAAAFALQHRPLLDMHFEIGMRREEARPLRRPHSRCARSSCAEHEPVGRPARPGRRPTLMPPAQT